MRRRRFAGSRRSPPRPGVSPGRAEASAALGAEVVRAGRTYDDSVRLCADAGRQNGWQIVSDTSWPGYEDVPKTVMQGYVVMVGEALAAGAQPSHVFVQGGVGGFWREKVQQTPQTPPDGAVVPLGPPRGPTPIADLNRK